MKKMTQVMMLSFTFSSLCYAGGDVSVPEVVPNTEPIVSASNLYAGLGISTMSLRNDFSDEEFSSTGVMLQLGYKVYPFLAIEGRYTKNVGNLDYSHGNAFTLSNSDYPGDFSNVAVYLKPQYTMEDVNIYALLGYGEVSLSNIPLGDSSISADRGEQGFQWGLGLAYEGWESISVFLDYVRLYDSDGFNGRATEANIVSDVWTLGVSYKF